MLRRSTLLLCALLPLMTTANETKPAAAPAAIDPFLRQYTETRGFKLGHPTKPTPTPDGRAVLFLRAAGPRTPVQSLFETDLATGQTRELLTAERLLAGAEQTLTVAEKARLERMRISARGIVGFELSPDGSRVATSVGGKLFVLDRASGKITALKTGGTPIDPKFSPDGRAVSYVRDHDVFAVELATNKERRITRGGSEQTPHGLAEFVAQEEMRRYSGYWWSPDARRLVFQESDESQVERFSIQDPMHPEKQATVFPYPRPGKPNVKVRLGITSAGGGGKTTWVKWDVERYPYLATVAWPEGAPLTLVVQNRVQTEEQVLKVDPATGKTTVLLTERDGAWLDLEQDFPRWLPDGSGFFWFTERNGDREIELRGADGARVATWVPPALPFAKLAGFDPAKRALYFTAAPDPTQRRLYRVVDGGKPEPLAVPSDAAAQDLAWLSKNGEALVVMRSTLREAAKVTAHRAADGAQLAELPSVAEAIPFALSSEIRKVAGDFWVTVTRPRTFTKGQKLPVIAIIYGGPTSQVTEHVQRPMDQWYADQGFLVVRVDGRGTPFHGSRWLRSVARDFSRHAIHDEADALKALAAELPELDLNRVGIEGWSFGGYNAALAVMQRPDVFKAAVAGAPVVDWRDYDTHYTERYLGLPDQNREGYDQSSLLTWAPKLGRPLLLVHGTADDNVYFFHSLKLSDALFRAGKPHRLLPLSGLTHMVPDPLVSARLKEETMRFFKESL